MNIVNPYKIDKQYTRISLEPYYMNNDILNNLNKCVKKKLEKKCNKSGYIDEIFRILEYNDGFLPPENLNGSALYNIIYQCRLCNPIENTINVGLVRIINSEIVIAINGPIMYFIPKGNVDTDLWNISENYMHIKEKKKLNIGNYIKIRIVNKRINNNDTQIKVIGVLLDFASSDDVNIYFGSKTNILKST